MKKAANLLESVRFAAAGFAHCFRRERNFRIHLTVAVFAVILALLLKISWSEFTVLLLLIALVIFSEMVNTAVENIMDLITPDYHPLAKVIKDVAAGAVLFICSVAVVIGVIIFAPYLIHLLTF